MKRWVWVVVVLVLVAAIIAVTFLAILPARQRKLDRALLDAVREGDARQVQILLRRGADPNTRVRHVVDAGPRTSEIVGGIPPLHWAATCESTEIAELLLSHGADVNASDWWGATALHVATNPRFRATKDMTKLLLAHGADANAVALNGRTPLHNAARGGSERVIELLIAEEAEVNVRDKDDKTPLDYAEDHPGAQELLRLHGAR